MMVQKPSGALIALGMGPWLLGQAGRRGWPAAGPARLAQQVLRAFAPVLLWGWPRWRSRSPYIVRNYALFGKPFYSTESHDAWVLGYGDWEDIYYIHTPTVMV
ncbi:MAG: hypothetical protein IPP13_28195 [Kouleothrix sp.]|nr:hypothetical protein [Kouleothrix sp.]